VPADRGLNSGLFHQKNPHAVADPVSLFQLQLQINRRCQPLIHQNVDCRAAKQWDIVFGFVHIRRLCKNRDGCVHEIVGL
jgi:hypothetical protein